MSSSSPSQAKNARGAKSNGSNTSRATAPTELKNAASTDAVRARPSDDEIARRAYEIYEREGRQPGSELQNWLKAEDELSGPKKH
jgi:tRNA A37 N6-isopentenylltransferase MiaA